MPCVQAVSIEPLGTGWRTKWVPCHKAWGRESAVQTSCWACRASAEIEIYFVMEGRAGWWKGKELESVRVKKKGAPVSGMDLICLPRYRGHNHFHELSVLELSFSNTCLEAPGAVSNNQRTQLCPVGQETLLQWDSAGKKHLCFCSYDVMQWHWFLGIPRPPGLSAV